MRRAITISLVLLCLSVTGCGRSAERDRAAAVTERFFAAVENDDGAAACAELAADTRKALEDDEQKPCREAIGSLQIEPGALSSVELYLTNGKADLDNGDSVFLSLTSDGWRLSAVGCKPGAGPSEDEPMECELEA